MEGNRTNQALLPSCPSSAHDRGKLGQEAQLPSCQGDSLGGERVIQDFISGRARVGRLQFVFAKYGQKFSICHTFLVPLPSAMANDRPSGDGIAYRM